MNWQKLNNSPVEIALFQIIYDLDDHKIEEFLKIENEIKHILPIRKNHVEANIDLPSTPVPLGISKITGTANAKIESYSFLSNDQKKALIVNRNTITYKIEGRYYGWEEFNNEIIELLKVLSPIIENSFITRTSLRFINKFNFKTFDNPTEYFKLLISSTSDTTLEYPVVKYGFKVTLDIKDNMYSIVNQNLEKLPDDFVYMFDIDVLERSRYIYDIDTLSSVLKELRNAKNSIFFGYTTQKLIDLCN